MYSINCKGRLIELDEPKIMGIINATPDSFFTGNRKIEANEAVDMAGDMLDKGATFLDLGGQSTRPGSALLSAAEELDRLLPIQTAILKAFPDAILSIDTFYHEVAKETIENGAAIINDISGGEMDKEMISTVGKLRVPYILMHMKGTPQSMTQLTQYDNMMEDILKYFAWKIKDCKKSGINDIIIDPGYGFAKNIQQNFELLRRLKEFEILDCPTLVGISRKGMIWKTLESNAECALNGTTVLNTLALLNGANILRVHDVKEAIEAQKLVSAYINA